MYPANSSKFTAIRPPSPTNFVNFSPPSDYPASGAAAAAAAAAATSASAVTSGLGAHHHNNHHHHNNSNSSMSMKHSHTKNNHNNNNNNNHNNFNKNMVSSATLGWRNELMFPDDVDSIEFCMPDNLNGTNSGSGSGTNSGTGNNFPGDSFTERRRRGHSRRSNHKLEVEQQVKWTRKNIAATMERFEPSNSGLSSSKVDYGTTTTQTTIQQQQQPPPAINHVYSYAYYEPGAAKCHTNIPSHKDMMIPPLILPSTSNTASGSVAIASTSSSASTILPLAGPSKSPPRNSIRALLAKSFRSKTLTNHQSLHHQYQLQLQLQQQHQHQQQQQLQHQQQHHHSSHSPLTSEERHTYTTRYGTTENLYEEVNDQKIRKVLSDNRIVSSINSPNVKEELRRVQHNHFRVLDELNLSLEALIMPPTPPDISPSVEEKISHASSMENLSSTLNSIELKDHTCINPEFDEGDLDSGFSGSGSSSGASYNESLRYYKTTNNSIIHTTTLPHNIRSCRSSTASGTSTSKSSMNSDDHGIGMTMMTTAIGTGTGTTTTTNTNNSTAINASISHHNNTNPNNHHIGSGTSTGSPFNFTRRCSDSQRSNSSGCGNSSTGTIATGINLNNGNSSGTTTNLLGTNGFCNGTKPKKHFWTIKQ